MHPATPKRLIAIEPISLVAARSWLGPWLEWLVAKIVAKEVRQAADPKALVFLVPDHCRRGLAGLATFRWAEIQFMGTAQADELAELVAFNEAAVQILGAGGESEQALAKSMRYAFLAPHSEGIPYWLSGGENLIRQEKIQEVTLYQFDRPFSRFLAHAARINNIPAGSANSFSAHLLSILERGYTYLCERWGQRPISSRGFNLQLDTKNTDVVLPLGKDRSERFAEPIRAAFARDFSRQAKFLGPGQLPKLGRSEQRTASYQRIQEQWQKAEPALRALPHTYRGLPIADTYLPFMKATWLQRAGRALDLWNQANQLLPTWRPRVVVLTEPIELSAIFALAARKHNIPVLSYYSIFDSGAPTAAIWESALSGIADEYATVNEWMRQRLLKKKIAAESQVHVVGDVIQDLTMNEMKAYDRRATREKLQVRQNRPMVVVLTRAISSVLLAEEKEWIFRGVAKACHALGAELVIKGHPNEQAAVLENEVNLWCGAGTKFVIREFPTGSLLAAADLVVGTPGSSSNMDAIYAGIPLVVAGREEVFSLLDERLEKNAFRKYEVAPCLTMGADFQPVLAELLRNSEKNAKWRSNAQAFAEKMSGIADGQAGRRIAAIAERMSR